MKILIIARGIPSDRHPQDGCFEWDQAKALAARGHEVIIMAIDGRVRKYWRQPGITQIEKDDITAYKLFYFPTAIIRRLFSLHLGYWIESLFAQKLFKYIVRKHGNFDIVHAHFLNCIFFGSKIKQNANCILVGTEHWSELNKSVLSEEVKYLGVKTYSSVDKLITVSKGLGQQIYNHFGVKSEVVHNLIDTSFLQKAETKTDNRVFTIIAVGSLIPRKGFDVLINAFSKSEPYKDGAVLKIIGSGSEHTNLEKLINSKGLFRNVTLEGQLTKKQIYALLHNADLFILSSHLENFSVAIIEASANGVPAIATLCGGTEEYPIPYTIKVPVNSIEDMTEAINKAYSQRENVDRCRIQQETLKNFSPEAISSKLEKIYTDLLSFESFSAN